jgi:hypothetical protein
MDAEMDDGVSRRVEDAGIAEEIHARLRLVYGEIHDSNVECSRLEDKH